jgi:hypothetical protein
LNYNQIGFADHIRSIELEMKDTTNTGSPASYTDPHLNIDSEARLRTKFIDFSCICSNILAALGSRIGGLMASLLASSVVDRGFEPQSGKIINYKTDIFWFSANHAALRSKSKDWMAQNQDKQQILIAYSLVSGERCSNLRATCDTRGEHANHNTTDEVEYAN